MGIGHMQLDNGDIYEGNFVLGKREGYGKISQHEDEMSYDGEWKDDV